MDNDYGSNGYAYLSLVNDFLEKYKSIRYDNVRFWLQNSTDIYFGMCTDIYFGMGLFRAGSNWGNSGSRDKAYILTNWEDGTKLINGSDYGIWRQRLNKSGNYTQPNGPNETMEYSFTEFFNRSIPYNQASAFNMFYIAAATKYTRATQDEYAQTEAQDVYLVKSTLKTPTAYISGFDQEETHFFRISSNYDRIEPEINSTSGGFAETNYQYKNDNKQYDYNNMLIEPNL